MKQKWLIGILVFFPLLVCAYRNDKFLLKGTISGLKDGTLVYLIQYSSQDTICQVKVKNSQFVLKGKVANGTEYFYLRIDTGYSNIPSKGFLLENKVQNVIGQLTKWPEIELRGSISNMELNEVRLLWIGSKEPLVRKAKIRNFILQHTSSIYVADLIRRSDDDFNLEERVSLYSKLSKEAKSCFFGEQLKKALDIEYLRTQIKENGIIPNFTLVGIDGKEISILELAKKAKYTLIDFWASWCKPCREEIPNLKNVFAEFNGSGFNIFSIALSDKESDWKKAIVSVNTNWVHGRDPENYTYKLFDVSTIPGYILIDSVGTIISFDCEGSKIKKFGPKIRGKDLSETIKHFVSQNNLSSGSCSTNPQKHVIDYQPLEVGDFVPDICLGTVINHPKLMSARISDFKGKLLILDFWSVYCAVCISLFPHMEALQKEFGDSIVILPVGFDGFKDGSIVNFLNKSVGTNEALNLPTAIQRKSDSLLMKLFPFGDLPHEVWIGSNGELLGVTDNFAVTSRNISSILKGEKLPFKKKKIKRKNLEKNEPLFLNRGSSEKVQFGSVFVNYLDTFSSISAEVEPSLDYPNNRMYWINATLFDLYKEAFGNEFPELAQDDKNKKIIFRGIDSGKYLDWVDSRFMDNWERDKFLENHLFGYEIIMPAFWTKKDMLRKLKADLDSFFNLRSFTEVQNMKYWELNNVVGGANVPEEWRNSKKFKQISIKEFQNYLNSKMQTKMPIVIGKLDNIDQTVYVSSKIYPSLEEIEDAIRLNGFQLQEKSRKEKVLILEKG